MWDTDRETLGAEIERLRAQVADARVWLQSIIDNPQVLASTTARAALAALGNDKQG